MDINAVAASIIIKHEATEKSARVQEASSL